VNESKPAAKVNILFQIAATLRKNNIIAIARSLNKI
jgi:hypothetical protein